MTIDYCDVTSPYVECVLYVLTDELSCFAVSCVFRTVICYPWTQQIQVLILVLPTPQ